MYAVIATQSELRQVVLNVPSENCASYGFETVVSCRAPLISASSLCLRKKATLPSLLLNFW